MAMTLSISHVIFDLDGLLLDTESQYTKAIGDYCASFGKTFTWEVKVKQMGRKPIESAKILLEELDIPDTPENCCDVIHETLNKMFPHCEQMPGAQALVEHLSGHGIPLAIATGSAAEDFKYKTQNQQHLMRHFSHSVISGSDPAVKHGKPAPDIFQVAAERFVTPPAGPEHCLVFEDAPGGVEAALAAGMFVVWVPDARADRSQFASQSRVTILDSLNDFRPIDFGLPDRPCP